MSFQIAAVGLGGRPGMIVLTSYLFLICGDHKGMPKMYSEVNSLLCCANLLVAVTCTAVVKCIYNLIASNTFTCGIYDHLYNQFIF